MLGVAHGLAKRSTVEERKCARAWMKEAAVDGKMEEKYIRVRLGLRIGLYRRWR